MPFTERQCRARVQAALDEIAVLGAGEHLSAGQPRYRLLLLQGSGKSVIRLYSVTERMRRSVGRGLRGC